MNKQESFDVVIIGAGIAGSYLANQLVSRGRTVALVEHGGAKLADAAEPLPKISCPARDHEGVRVARHHVVGGNSGYWGGALIRNRPREIAALLGDPEAPPGMLDEYYEAVERIIGVPHEPTREAGPEGLAGDWCASEVFVLPGRARNIARSQLASVSREASFRLLADHRVEKLTRTGEGNLESVVVIDADGARHELVAREVVVCAGAADSVLFCQQFARELGIEGHPLLGTRMHDHFSTPLFKVHAAGHRRFTDAYAPSFAGAFIVGHRLEIEVETSSGWNPAGFLHFQYKFDMASPYREVKALLSLRQRGGAIHEYVRSTVGMFGALPSSLRVGFDRYFRRKLYVSRAVEIVATFDFESFPSPRNRLHLETGDSGADRAVFDWDLRDEDLEAFRSFYPRLKGAMESLAGRYSLKFEPVETLATGSLEDHLVHSATDAYHLGGGVQSAADPSEGILRPDLKLHTARNVHMVSSAVFRRPGIANPVHTLLALASRLSAELGS